MSDAGRDIAYIRYDYNNNPVLIVFKDGHETEYIYSATGEKLRVIYTTAKPRVITREIGKDITERLPENYRVSTPETVDYLLGGALTLRNGVIDKYQFEEGYCQATPLYYEGKPFAETFTFCYYDQDHLGNIRQVTMDDGSSKGEVIQTMDYYPFGAEFCDGGTKSYVQNHKYNGKEFDNMHGLNTYDYGARQYNPVTGRWDRMDPHSESYYPHSPFAYCANNPVMLVDLDGMDWYSRTDENGAVIYQYFDGSNEIEGWTNIGANHTVTCGNITYNYVQNEMVSMTETVLTPDDWCSQMTLVNGRSVKKQPKETEGDCFYQSGNMVKKSGTTSLGGTANNVCKDKKIDNKKMQSYIDSQIDCGYSVRVQVDRKTSKEDFDGNGDHWVAIAARITDMRTGKESFQFFDPGTVHPNNGTSKNNCFKFNPTSNCWTSPAYDSMKYNLINVRKNIKRER